MSAPPIDSSKLLADIVRSAFEHHKNHARFQEIQRRWLNVTFLTATSAALYFLGNGNNSAWLFAGGKPTPVFWICLATHFALAVLISLITTKHSGEFQRHFRRGDEVLTSVRDLYVDYFAASEPDAEGKAQPQPLSAADQKRMSTLRRLFDVLVLETSSSALEKTGRSGIRGANFARIISASRGTIYFYAAIVAFDVALATYLLTSTLSYKLPWPPKALAAIAFVFVFIVWSAVLIRFLRAIAGAGVSDHDVKC